MNDFKRYTKELGSYSFIWVLISSLLITCAYIILSNIDQLNTIVVIIITASVAVVMSISIAKLIVKLVSKQFNAARLSINNQESNENTQTILSPIVKVEPVPIPLAQQPDLLELMPLPVIALDASDNVSRLNQVALQYLGKTREEIIGKPVFDALQLSFQSKDTLETWLTNTKANSVTSTASWDRVRIQLNNEQAVKQFDLIAHYNKGNTANCETLLALFDHTDRYSKEDSNTSYVALAVHELRTPLTVLRGYIEVFEDELSGKLTPELQDFMHKMRASAQTLTAFVSNILNVARVDENQLTLSLHETNWNQLLPEIAKDIELRAKVRGKTIELDIKPNLPTVAVDKVSIYEVVSNLVDNAIKYSADQNKIIIHAGIGKEGDVETVIQDFGVGVPEASLKYLFTKFYRGHRSKGGVSGSGLGLYLVKAIVSAHGGNVWVNSKEGEGSSFGFSLKPYANVADNLNESSGTNIEREAHGWIKNHSMYRR